MLKQGILNSQVRSLLSRIGHGGTFAIVDAGCNCPKGVKVIDLAFLPNIPSMLQVLDGILNEMVLEKAFLFESIQRYAPELHQEYLSRFSNAIEISYVSRDAFESMLSSVKGIIRTGGYGLHATNLILQGGCSFD